MLYRVEQISTPSSDGIHTLKGVIYIPEGEIKGIFHLVHGMTEYIGRYEGIFSYLAERGYVCAGYDNLGHGSTAENENELGFIAERDGWRYLVRDVSVFGKKLRKLYPDKEYYLFGHSMGSFIVRLAAAEQPEHIKKLIICGTAGPMAIAPLGLMLINIIKAIKGGHYVSRLVDTIAFGAYNKRFTGPTKYEWLTNDRSIIDKYIKDKFCTFGFTVSAMHDLITMTSKCNSTKWFNTLSKELPVLLIAGDCDPVGNYGKGVRAVYDKLIKAGKQNTKIKIYENCRHEILNDTLKDEVMADVFEFLEV